MIRWFNTKNTGSPQERKQPGENEVMIVGSDTISLIPLTLGGKREGNYYVGDVVTVETDADVKGNIMSYDAVIKGKVSGRITCKREVIIAATALINADVEARTVVMEPGAVLNGSLVTSENVSIPGLAEKIQKGRRLLEMGKPPGVLEDNPGRLPGRENSRLGAAKEQKRAERPPFPEPDTSQENGNWW